MRVRHEIGLDDVTGLAGGEPDLRTGEQFALSVMQLLLDSSNYELPPSDLGQIVSGDETMRFLLYGSAVGKAADMEQGFLVKDAG